MGKLLIDFNICHVLECITELLNLPDYAQWQNSALFGHFLYMHFVLLSDVTINLTFELLIDF